MHQIFNKLDKTVITNKTDFKKKWFYWKLKENFHFKMNYYFFKLNEIRVFVVCLLWSSATASNYAVKTILSL